MISMILRRVFESRYMNLAAVASLACLFALVVAPAVDAQNQTADAGYRFENANPAYPDGTGPTVQIHRFVSPYVQRGSFDAFKTLIESDGFNARWLDKQISGEVLEETNVLVIANAYTKGGARDFNNFSTLEAPSVYNDAEIALIANWVRDGGSLLILADHSPFAGGTIKLAEALGFTFMTGVAVHKSSISENIISNIDFRREGESRRIGRLSGHPIVDGGLGRPRISHYFAFEGQAIIPPPQAASLLTIPKGYETILTLSVREEFYTAMRLDASGFSQGAVLDLDNGRIGVFGETGGFTSQVRSNVRSMGLAAPEADENAEFVLSTLRWLAKFQP